jgi:hypothetical protein
MIGETAQGLREKAQRSIDAGVEFTYDARLIIAALDDAEAKGAQDATGWTPEDWTPCDS